MNQKSLITAIVSGFAGLVLLLNSLYIVEQTQIGLIFQFGELVRVVDAPGLKFRVPFIQNIVLYDNRLLDYNLPVIEVTAEDQKRIVVDLYARYKVKDPFLFYKTVGNIMGAQNRLATIVPASMRRVIGRVPLSNMLSPERAKIMHEIREEAIKSAESFGIEVRDVRIIRADLPKENSEAIFNRMESERKQEAKQFRAEGHEKALEIRSSADKQKTIMLAEAEKKAQILQGEADALTAEIFAKYSDNKDFFAFFRSMIAYQEALQPSDTTIILSPTSEFFEFFGSKPQ
ncbi:MAG: protease modulator HflC [Alphaproteobacteria bacterium]|nr:protease modulator HflC [Alphaproteobacteria bacterium]MBX9976857.1 protease modulator HflC [Alphaproteobacteria bacterium]